MMMMMTTTTEKEMQEAEELKELVLSVRLLLMGEKHALAPENAHLDVLGGDILTEPMRMAIAERVRRDGMSFVFVEFPQVAGIRLLAKVNVFRTDDLGRVEWHSSCVLHDDGAGLLAAVPIDYKVGAYFVVSAGGRLERRPGHPTCDPATGVRLAQRRLREMATTMPSKLFGGAYGTFALRPFEGGTSH